MKFYIYKDAGGEWRWNAQAGGNILFSSGEGFEKPQKIVQVIRKNIIREDESLEKALVKGLKAAGLNEKGNLLIGKAASQIAPLPKKEIAPWPFPVAKDKSLD